MIDTILFISLLSVAILFGLKSKTPFVFDKSVTNDLKVFSFFVVVFSHIGYFLFTDHSLFYPFSNYGGVAVNIFFFLSAYGLSFSFAKWKGNLKGYYNKRLHRIVPSIWLTIALIFILDLVWHGHVYGFGYMVQNFLLWYPHADLYTDIDSPLWYITPLVIYYLTFPFLYKEGKPWLSAGIILVFGYLLSLTAFVCPLFSLHYIAFPLGVLFAHYLPVIKTFFEKHSRVVKTIIPIVLFVFVVVTGIYSGVGTFYEQYISNLTMIALVLFLFTIPFSSSTLTFLSAYSFEFYLLHWPLMNRFDIFFKIRSVPWLWLTLWIIVLIGIAELFKKVISRFKLGMV